MKVPPEQVRGQHTQMKGNTTMQSITSTDPMKALAAEVRSGVVVLRDLDDDQLSGLLGYAQGGTDPDLYAVCYAHVAMRRAMDHAEEMDRVFDAAASDDCCRTA